MMQLLHAWMVWDLRRIQLKSHELANTEEDSASAWVVLRQMLQHLMQPLTVLDPGHIRDS